MHELDKTLEALKPCPFCGGEAERCENSLTGLLSMAQCRQCGATAFDAKWNRRASSTSAGVTEEQTPLDMRAALEALRLFQSYGCPVCGGDCASANPPVSGCPMQAAQAALEASRAPVSQKEAVPVAFACKADIDALTEEGKDLSLSTVAMPKYGMNMPLYASPVPAPAGERGTPGWTYMPTYGEVAFEELVDAVAEAVYADRNYRPSSWEIDPSRFIGHQIVPTINFNSLNRIVSAFLRSALHPSPPPVSAPVGESKK